MAEVNVIKVSKQYGESRALDDVSIRFAEGGLYGLLGPSGSGKTTLLRMIAGFVFPDSGQIRIDDQPVERLPVERREIGMVFQNYALFPNMNVADNVAFGLSVRHVDKSEIKRRVGEVLDLVQLGSLHARRINQLSGGQRQRVALARAIVTRPRVLLLDEPLSALDKSLRVDMQVELRRIQRDVAITTVFVTHDQEEALTLSDRVGILRDGRLIQEGTARELYDQPASEFAATFLGDANILNGRLETGGMRINDGSLIRFGSRSAVSNQTKCAVRPEKIVLQRATGEAAPSVHNRLTAQVAHHVFAGVNTTYMLDWCGQRLKVHVQNSGEDLIPVGSQVTLSWSPDSTILVH